MKKLKVCNWTIIILMNMLDKRVYYIIKIMWVILLWIMLNKKNIIKIWRLRRVWIFINFKKTMLIQTWKSQLGESIFNLLKRIPKFKRILNYIKNKILTQNLSIQILWIAIKLLIKSKWIAKLTFIIKMM